MFSIFLQTVYCLFSHLMKLRPAVGLGINIHDGSYTLLEWRRAYKEAAVTINQPHDYDTPTCVCRSTANLTGNTMTQ